MDWLTVSSLALAAAGLAQAGLMLIYAWEHYRYHRSRRQADFPPGSSSAPSVMLFVPCRGLDVQMDANLRALFAQQYPRFKLCFVVEDADDPACAVIRRLQRQYPQAESQIVFAGDAVDCGQKVHNLMRATTCPSNDSEVLAFVDSDARPHRHFVARLVGRLERGKFAVATGYRWYVPRRPSLANRTLAAINNTVVGVMGSHGFNLVWGGAWAIRKETFHRLGLPQAWEGTLSDDLVVSRLVHESGLAVAYEPNCLVVSPADFTWCTLAEFLCRQYLVARVYAPRWWRFALAASTLTNGVVWGLILSAAWLAWAGGPWLIAAGGIVAVYLLTACRAALTAAAVAPFVAVAAEEYRGVARVNIWAWPFVSLMVWLGLLGSTLGRTIVWRGKTYRLESARQTTILGGPEDQTRSPQSAKTVKATHAA
ncbi:MAG: glycosyltransferase [Planctomycetaceae bacterium]